MDKAQIRARLLTQRRSLSAGQAQSLSKQVEGRLLALDVVTQAGMIALYSPIHNEVATQGGFRYAVAAGGRVCYPRVCGSHLEFVEVTALSELVPGCFGVMEPPSGQVIAVADIDVVLVPGVAFDRYGHRLGYGRGYYDRFLEAAGSTVKIGVCYDFQLCDKLPDEEHDQRLDGIVSNAEVIPCRDGAAGLS